MIKKKFNNFIFIMLQGKILFLNEILGLMMRKSQGEYFNYIKVTIIFIFAIRDKRKRVILRRFFAKNIIRKWIKNISILRIIKFPWKERKLLFKNQSSLKRRNDIEKRIYLESDYEISSRNSQIAFVKRCWLNHIRS